MNRWKIENFKPMNELDQLAADVGAVLKNKGLLLATAESCTGGGIAEAITRIPGSSAWFDCAFVTYSNEAKISLLGVSLKTLTDHGAVSEETAREMAEGAFSRSRADTIVAVSGIAGPTGGQPGKPVGTVCFAWKISTNSIISEICNFSGDRAAVRHQTIVYALTQLLHNLA